MNHIWRLVAEIQVEPGDTKSGLRFGFINVLTWAESAESATEKLAAYLRRFNWHIISIEDARPVSEEEQFDDEEMQDMLERTRKNPNAIILGTLYTYKPT